MRRYLVAVAGLALAFSSIGMAQAAVNSLGINYFEVSETSGYGAGGDFGTCCASPPATGANIALGAGLGPNGLPVNHGNVVDTNPSTNEILWWTPSAINGVSHTGSGSFAVDGNVYGMYAPSSTGSNDGTYFETAILSGYVTGKGGDVQLSVTSDDDLFVYLNGQYVGGEPGVHGAYATTIDLGDLTGSNPIKIFYADRAQTGAYLGLGVTGGVTGVPELSTWGMLLIGFAGLGFAGYRTSRRNVGFAA